MKIIVSNMHSTNGNLVPNQFKIYTSEGSYFQSYRTIIAFIDNNGKVFLDEDSWDYSRTTSKYRNLFLNKNTQEIKQLINEGEYKLKNLN
tara:strand:- start:802 stop:1071 length:270 start_codon:yes stop_codon:yes gene_type:complete